MGKWEILPKMQQNWFSFFDFEIMQKISKRTKMWKNHL